MKMIKFLVVALVFFSGAGAQAEQKVRRALSASGSWSAAEVTGHALFGTDACLAFTKARDGSTLEVYAPRLSGSETEYTEPTVLIVTKGAKPYIRGILEDDGARTKVNLMLASTKDEKPAFGLVARVDERKLLVEILRRASVATVRLVNEKNREIGRIGFSLKGSTKNIDGAFGGCGLRIE